MPVNIRDVFKIGGKFAVVVNINDCRAACVYLFNRNFDDAETVINPNEQTFGISPNSMTDIIGRFKGKIEARPSMAFDRDKKSTLGHVMMPAPGFNTPAKKKRRPVASAIPDDGALPQESGVISDIRRGLTQLSAIVKPRSV